MLTVEMETQTFTVLANQRALLVLKSAEKNLKNKKKTIAKMIASAASYVEISSIFVLFSS